MVKIIQIQFIIVFYFDFPVFTIIFTQSSVFILALLSSCMYVPLVGRNDVTTCCDKLIYESISAAFFFHFVTADRIPSLSAMKKIPRENA